MNKTNFKEFWEIIELLEREDALRFLIIVGSWAEYIYEESQILMNFKSELRTRDIDFVIKNKRKPNSKINLSEIFKNNGYLVENDRLSGKTRIITQERLEIEFLLSKVGAGLEDTMSTNLGVTAETLRNIDILRDNTISVYVNEYILKVPCPEAYVIQKIIINKDRKDKSKKDIKSIKNMIPHLNLTKSKEIYESLTKKNKKKIIDFDKNVEKLGFID